jgi:hypothetical protein
LDESQWNLKPLISKFVLAPLLYKVEYGHEILDDVYGSYAIIVISSQFPLLAVWEDYFHVKKLR